MLFVNCFRSLLCFALRSFNFLFHSCFVFCFLFASRSCLWPLLLFRFSFCKFGFSSLALVFGFCLAFASYFCFSFMALIWLSLLLFVFHFLFSILVRFSFLTSIFHFSFMGESTLQWTKIEGCGVHN